MNLPREPDSNARVWGECISKTKNLRTLMRSPANVNTKNLNAFQFGVLRCEMRSTATAVFIFTLSLGCVCSSAAGPTDGPTVLAELQDKVDQTQPKDRCLIYAELVSRMTDLVPIFINSYPGSNCIFIAL